jgi:hypothetical protein
LPIDDIVWIISYIFWADRQQSDCRIVERKYRHNKDYGMPLYGHNVEQKAKMHMHFIKMAELTDESSRAFAFSLFPVTWVVGTTLGM